MTVGDVDQALDAFLSKVKRGGAKFPELAARLRTSEGAIFVYGPEASAELLQSQGRGPPPVALADGAGQPLACLFSQHAHARAFATANGFGAEGAGAYVTRIAPWPGALREIFLNPYRGAMLDFGQPHALGFSEVQLRKLYAYLLWERHLTSQQIHLLWNGAQPYVLRAAQGSQASATFDDDAASAMVLAFRGRAAALAGLTHRTLPLREGLDLLWKANVSQLVINDQLPDWHVYGRDELSQLRASAG